MMVSLQYTINYHHQFSLIETEWINFQTQTASVMHDTETLLQLLADIAQQEFNCTSVEASRGLKNNY